MDNKVQVAYYFNEKRPLLQFRGQFGQEDILEIFLNKNLGLVPYTFSPTLKNQSGEASFVADSSQRARDITKRLTTGFEKMGYELIYPMYFFKSGKNRN